MIRLALALVLLFAFFGGSHAGVLLEARLNGVPLKLEMGLSRSKILVEAGGVGHLVDLDSDSVYRTEDGETTLHRAGEIDDGASSNLYRLVDWSEGPPVAGHGSRYSVLQLDETICGEVLASRWMMEFMEEIGRAIELVQRVDRRLRPIVREGCGVIPFRAYWPNGWPLMAGWRDETVFEADILRFDHTVEEDRLIPPADLTR